MKDARRNCRKNYRLTGFLLGYTDEMEFCIQNLSNGGFLAYFKNFEGVHEKTMLPILLPAFKLKGYAYPVWQKTVGRGAYKVGFKVLSLEGVDGFKFSYPPKGKIKNYTRVYAEANEF